MKKFFKSALATTLAVSLAVMGTGCSSATKLSFSNNFAGGSAPSSTTAYTETLVYNVENVSEYESISTSNLIKQDVPTYKGTFTMVFKNQIPSDIELPTSDISNLNDFKTSDKYYVQSVLDLNVTINGKTYNDAIVSECCFYQANLSFAPIYSKTTAKTTFLNLSSDKLDLTQTIYQYVTVYNSESYNMTKKSYTPDQGEDVNLIDIKQNNWTSNKFTELDNNGNASYEYDLRSVIDSNQLLFAIRNIAFSESLTELQIPTVSYSYGESVPLLVQNQEKETFNLKYNLADGSERAQNALLAIPINKITFKASDSYFTGPSKIIKLQEKATDDLAYNSLILEFAEPLFDVSMNMFGALKYTLKQCTINK